MDSATDYLKKRREAYQGSYDQAPDDFINTLAKTRGVGPDDPIDFNEFGTSPKEDPSSKPTLIDRILAIGVPEMGVDQTKAWINAPQPSITDMLAKILAPRGVGGAQAATTPAAQAVPQMTAPPPNIPEWLLKLMMMGYKPGLVGATPAQNDQGSSGQPPTD